MSALFPRNASHSLLVVALAAAVLSSGAAAQLPHAIPAGDSALASCARAAARGDKRAANSTADTAEQSYNRTTSSGERTTPTVRLARVIAECRLPVASFFSKPKLAGKAEAMLEGVLATDSTNWEARYTLALLYYHAPSFVGKTHDAIVQFETLLAQQGSHADFAEQAAPYAYLGDLYERVGRRDDAVTLWRRGLALFPGDARLAQRLARAAGTP